MFLRYCSVIAIPAAILLPVVLAAAPFDDCVAPKNAVDLTIQSSLFPSLPGQAVTFTAFVEPILGAGPGPGADPTGTVQLADGDTDLGTFNLRLGQVSATTVFNAAGAHSIFATYSGDDNYCGGAVRFGQQVNRFVTTIDLTSSASTAGFGQPVTFTARLGPPVPAGVAGPTGQIQFFDGSTPLGTAAPSAGVASFTPVNLSPGSHQISAMYSGDFNWFSVRSAALGVTVSKTATATVLTAVSNLTQVTLTASVSAAPPGSGTPSGTVQFVDATTNAALGSAPLTAGTANASLAVTASQIAASAGHPITAVYSGDSNFAASTSNALGIPVLVNAASGSSLAASQSFAPDEIVSLFGPNLASATAQSSGVPLPTTLGLDIVTVTDSASKAQPAGLYLVSPGQINFVIPTGAAPGAATVSLTTGTPANPGSNSSVIPIQITIASTAPGLFTAAANGKGLAAAQIVRVHADGTQTIEAVSATPISMGADTLYLVLYGTGIRHRPSIGGVTCMINSVSLPVAYAGAQPQFPGLDQVDVLLPASLKGAGQVNATITVDGQVSNSVTLAFQ